MQQKFLGVFLSILFHVIFLFCMPTKIMIQLELLIVSYQTGPKAERLDRIRFWLKNNKNQAQLYPKGSVYVDDPSFRSRTVAIEDLAPGLYTIEFIIPNSDKLFETVPKREVAVIPGKIIKIDQVLKPRYAGIRVVTKASPDGEIFDTPPTVSLHDPSGKIHAQTTVGKFVNQHLLPGRYILTFDNVKGFQSPPPMELTLGPNEIVGPIEGIYIKALEEDVLNEYWFPKPTRQSNCHRKTMKSKKLS